MTDAAALYFRAKARLFLEPRDFVFDEGGMPLLRSTGYLRACVVVRLLCLRNAA